MKCFYLLTPMENAYDELSQEWNEYKQRPLPAFNLLLPLGHDGICLDAGTGNGRHLSLLSQKYSEVYAIDNSQKLLSIAATNNAALKNVHFDFSDITLLPFENKMFDDVYCVAVLHHLPTQTIQVAFKEIHRVLKTNGLLIASVWNKEQAKFTNLQKEDYVSWKMKTGKTVKRFIHFFEEEEIKQLAKENDFNIVEIFYEKNGKKTTEKSEAGNLCFVLQKKEAA